MSEGQEMGDKRREQFCNWTALKFLESFSNLRIPWLDSRRQSTPSTYTSFILLFIILRLSTEMKTKEKTEEK